MSTDGKSSSSLISKLNSLLLTVVLALGAWTVKEVNELGRNAASAAERYEALKKEHAVDVAHIERELADIRARQNATEAQLVQLRLDIERFRPRSQP